MKQYPDISDILARKARGRKPLAKLSFGEKLDLLDRMRENVQPLVVTRLVRRAGSSASSVGRAGARRDEL